ncbi:hypothetical protein APA_1141 [Pseudanabaena sp. lw0831]|nr:hypothetical protein APA_1141 [Pseudanabaena sp. lw0831]
MSRDFCFGSERTKNRVRAGKDPYVFEFLDLPDHNYRECYYDFYLSYRNTAMADPLTASVLVGLAVQKFVESGAGELAKKFTTEAIAKIPELWQQIKNKLQGRSPKVDEALMKLESGDRSAIETITKNLDVALDDDETFAALLQKLAQEINAGQIIQVGLDGITANRVAADIVQNAKGDRVEQIGARDVNAAGDAVFKVKQTID